jgi:hypothetical protein
MIEEIKKAWNRIKETWNAFKAEVKYRWDRTGQECRDASEAWVELIKQIKDIGSAIGGAKRKGRKKKRK